MKEVNPKETTRAYAFEMWMNAPMPMVTLFKAMEVSRLVRISRQKGLKFNMLMGWCIGRAASRIDEFYLLPVGRKLMQYDRLAVCTIVANREGGISSCDVPFSEDLPSFNTDYLRLTRQVAECCEDHNLPDCMVIGTSALTQCEIDGAVGVYSGVFNNPFLIWVQQSVPDLGQIQAAFLETVADRFFPVPPYADGRGACHPLFGRFAERNQGVGGIISGASPFCFASSRHCLLFIFCIFVGGYRKIVRR